MRAWAAIVALLALGAEPMRAQERSWHVDGAVLTLVEAWDYNEARESLLGGAAGVDAKVWKALRVRVEGQLLRVMQDGSDALLRGVTVGARVHWKASRVLPFADLAGGVSSSTRPVAPRGTTFNLLIVAGGGVQIPLNPRWSVDLGARWLHISNNGREGRHRNPDVQALGASIAIGWSW